MNAIAPRPLATIPATLPDLPRLSRPVAVALDHAIAPAHGAGLLDEISDDGRVTFRDPGHRLPPPLLSPPAWEEAQRAASVLDGLLAPVTSAIVSAWLMPLNLAARNPQTTEQFALRAAAIAEMVGDLPAAAFTAETRRKVGSKGFFPSADDVRAAIEPIAGDWRRKRDALRGLHRAVAPAATKPDPIETPDERAANAERNRHAIQALHDMAAEREAQARPSAMTQPNHIGPAQRIAYHRERGNHATADAIAKHHGMDANLEVA